MSGTSPFNKTNVNMFSTVATTVIHEVWIPLSCLILLPFYPIHPLSDKTKCSPVLKKVFVSSADACTRLTVTVMQNVRLLVLLLLSLSYLRRSPLPPPQPHPPAFLKTIAGKFERLEFHAKSNPQLLFVQTWHKYDAVPVMSK